MQSAASASRGELGFDFPMNLNPSTGPAMLRAHRRAGKSACVNRLGYGKRKQA